MTTLKIHTFREGGHATNSSSSHSVVIAGSERNIDDGGAKESREYGWEAFLCKTPKEKRDYLGTMTLGFFEGLPETVRKVMLEKALPGFKVKVDGTAYVDHNSVLTPPLKWDNRVNAKDERLYHNRSDTNAFDWDWWFAFCNAIADDSSAFIVGGNDNSDNDHGKPAPGWRDIISILRWTQTYVRWDGRVWTLVGPTSLGEGVVKIRGEFILPVDGRGGVGITVNGRKPVALGRPTPIILKQGAKSPESHAKAYTNIWKRTLPELVDLKITDKCDKGCSYCYQGSTPKGKHAPLSNVTKAIAAACYDGQVIEVAIGGGEPTSHPQFDKILRSCKSYGLIPSFSTRSLKWIKKPTLLKAVRETCNAVAFSVDTVDDVKAVMAATSRDVLEPTRVVWHYVVDAHPLSNLKKILDFLGKDKEGNWWFREFVFLGWKEGCGRAKNVPFPAPGYMKLVRSYTRKGWDDKPEPLFRVSVDTCIAARYPKELDDVDPARYYVDEGWLSLYIDAVAGTYARSSYSAKPVKVPDPSLTQAHEGGWGTAFADFAKWKAE
jgi:hypothetical protein